MTIAFAACAKNPVQPVESGKPAEPAPAAGQAAPAAPAGQAQDFRGLLSPETATAKAPDVFRAKVATTKGDFVVEVTRAWAPNGADRFFNLVKIGYYDDVAFFRVIGGFMAQFGIHGSPEVNAKWRPARIMDDPTGVQSNKRGTVTFAMGGPNTRTTQLFISFGDNAFLDNQGFPPFGVVKEGMDVVDKLYNGYGEGAPQGRGPEQGRAQMEGNAYFKTAFPDLDYIKTARIVP
ncbi:MAG: peptidylprolyl isomerase [Elusimicrobia bacterium]|nr:peptidylprolyl isomerase [Elusimicrobiota bacterium]